MNARYNNLLINICLGALSIALTYLALEGSYRVYMYKTLSRELIALAERADVERPQVAHARRRSHAHGVDAQAAVGGDGQLGLHHAAGSLELGDFDAGGRDHGTRASDLVRWSAQGLD